MLDLRMIGSKIRKADQSNQFCYDMGKVDWCIQ